MADATLIARARAGDQQAFEALLRQYERPVLGLCQRLLGAGGEAEEAAQDVFFRFYCKLSRFDEERAIEPWLLRIAWNACLDRLRRRRPQVELDDRIAAAPSNPLAAVVLDELRQAISRLPDKERSALLLREIEGLDTGEVAARMGSTPVTVRTHISRARARLKAWLGGTK